MTSGRTLTCADTLHCGPSFWVGVAGIADFTAQVAASAVRIKAGRDFEPVFLMMAAR
jgi:hypothetical protein